MIVPTVKIKFPANLRHGYAIINESDFDPAIHELLEPDPLDHDGDGKKGGSIREDGPTVAEFVEAGYLASNYPPAGYASRSTDEEIAAAITAQQEATGGDNGNSGTDTSEGADGTPTPIPADWRDMHHTKIIALAKELAGDFEATADKTITERARSIIEAAEHDRANPPAKTE